MTEEILDKTAALAALPNEWEEDLLPTIQQQLNNSARQIVVLDDDPTGTQTVYGTAVLTEWSVDILVAELQKDQTAFYILTNSRSLPEPKAAQLNREIGENLRQAAVQTGRDYTLVSRSDSTLRGHFPLEVEVLADTIPSAIDGYLLIPFFLEGGRYTINDVHYVAEGGTLIPAGETPFAQDKAFGYTQSNLTKWVEEKSNGRFPATAVCAISIDEIRTGGPKAVAKRLRTLPKGSICVVNSASYRDQEVFVSGLLTAEAQGCRFLYRTAASFVRPRIGLPARPLLTAVDLTPAKTLDPHGGLTVVGSYVPKTTRQLKALLESGLVQGLELNVSQLLEDSDRYGLLYDTITKVNELLYKGQDVVVYTSRELITSNDPAQSLAIGNVVSRTLVQIVQGLTIQPRYLIAKGGITSSDVATKGLGIKRALVQGQILPGIPVWQTQEESRYPYISYIVFPGNVGDDDALLTAVQNLQTR